MHLGTPEIILILVLAFLVFGPKRLPELARSIGEGIREFKKSMSAPEERPAPAAPAPAVEERAQTTEEAQAPSAKG